MDQEAAKAHEQLENFDRILNLVFPLVLIPFGSISNIITVFIYQQKPFKNTSIRFYYSILAITDTLALVIGSVKFFLMATNLIGILTFSSLGCKFFITSVYILSEYSAWVLVITSIDRLISILNYPSFIFLKTKKFRYSSSLILFFVIFLFNYPSFIYLQITIEQVNINNRTKEIYYTCELDSESYYTNELRDFIDLLMFALLPFLFMIIANGLISYKIIKSKNKFRRKASLAQPKKRKKEYQLAITIIGMNFLFLILNLPICVIQIMRNLGETDYSLDVNYNIAYTIANILTYINFSSSLYINLLFNHIFKSRFKHIIFSFFLNNQESSS
ncbi:FMRFamide receptor-like [Brachionus plicatilis]|uniref:FMRFamide receptor-like n=1 Tax=Brachionus plicatilis TaxID=10195 RepID=A0A3M7QAP1_BRAPC|nr:FMRFamide receptor-like [Brachionus plicatilis]